MADGTRCKCQRCTISGLMGPVVLITIGVLFLVDRIHWRYSFISLLPALLVVIGVLKLAEALASTAGHIGS